ncbi:MAG: sugar ABC transporter ATP-binding protein [Defluviitaleaceae bacterium]|nr:sugar ABC transporter ATP-binding protein [Defluviitaleaceae bacterium]MCL2837090.1 sugar ABC transporter ATP-binding protein [Defluviitaleaceae bacterium]
MSGQTVGANCVRPNTIQNERKLIFSAKDIHKHYGATHALKGAGIDIREGEIIGLVGENGAGKSTLLKIIIGAEEPSSGSLTMHGKLYSPRNPMDANRAGVGMVFQEQSLIVSLTVGQNLFFGHEREFSKFRVINWKKLYKEAASALADVGAGGINPRKKVSDLNFATRQMIEIAKVINVTKGASGEKCLILLDEPTSVLSEHETRNLFEQMKKIAAKGHAVVFVSHRLDEVLEITDRVYVYKDGEGVGDLLTPEATESKLYEMMVGRTASGEYYQVNRQREAQEEIMLEVKDLGLSGVFKHVSFQLRRGEILGVCGVVGSGKEELCEVICGDEKPTSGEMYIKGKKVVFSSPAHGLREKVIMIPKERLAQGIIRTLSIEDNIAISSLKILSRNKFVTVKSVRKQALEWISRLRIKTRGPRELLMRLSGGNQQKVVFSRALASKCDILVLNHPTRGVDVGAKEEIYTLIRGMVTEGKAVILLGDTLDECIGMSSRVIVMKDGLVTGEFAAPPDGKPGQVDVVSLMM